MKYEHQRLKTFVFFNMGYNTFANFVSFQY